MSTRTPPSTFRPDGEPIGPQPQTGEHGSAKRRPLTDGKEPHERDESPQSGSAGKSATDPRRDDIAQASEDKKRGLIDTDRRGTPDDIPHQEQHHGTRTRSSTSRS